MQEGLVRKAGLSEADLAEIRQLFDICGRYDGFEAKLNWGLLDNRARNEINDFCYYKDGRLVGYVPLDGFGSEYEVTGLVQPEYRRQGIFRQLMTATLQDTARRPVRQVLLVSYRAFPAEKAVAAAFGGQYENSEYRMVATPETLPGRWPSGELKLVQVKLEDLGELARLLKLSFSEDGWNVEENLRRDFQERQSRYFFARLRDQNIGQLGVIEEGEGVYIRGVGIEPDYRGQGYGRQLLAAVVQAMLAEGHRHFELDVVTENRNALSLYQSCGFREANVYDYYKLPLQTN
jgi:ribosomal protein S18 acetylase RimI-like enzyme